MGTAAPGKSGIELVTRHPVNCTRSPPLPLDADALILVTLGGYHDIGFIQDKDFDLLGVNEFQLGAPIQDGARCANDNLFSNLLATFHYSWKRSRADVG